MTTQPSIKEGLGILAAIWRGDGIPLSAEAEAVAEPEAAPELRPACEDYLHPRPRRHRRPVQPVQIPEPGEPGYITPAERFAQAADPVQQAIAGEQAIAEHLELAELAEAEAFAEAETEVGL